MAFAHLDSILAKTTTHCLAFFLLALWTSTIPASEPSALRAPSFFTLEGGIDLRALGGPLTRKLLKRVRGRGTPFGPGKAMRYCRLKQDSRQVQWVVNDLETGEILSISANAGRRFFGASVAKLFVAAALLHKRKGILSSHQLDQMVRMIVVSDNRAWKDLQRQVGEDGSNDSGREAVQRFVLSMGYANTRGHQGWLTKKDGTRIHGNELNALEVSRFLRDTYSGRYEGAEILWKLLHATRTGGPKIDKYTPSHLYIGGKTGSYSGPNESPDTIEHRTIRARNHAAILAVNGSHYGLSILTNTGLNEDVAVLGGGLMREYLGVEKALECPS